LVEPVVIYQKDDDLIMSLLSMLDYISINFLSNSMDRNVIFKQRKSGFLKTYEVLENYITYKRRVWGRPNAYRSFEEIIKNYILAGPEISDHAGRLIPERRISR
jgi:hypothetical protein